MNRNNAQQQQQPFNVFAPGGPKIMGKFESMPDTMPSKAPNDKSGVPATDGLLPYGGGAVTPHKSVSPDAMPEKAPSSVSGGDTPVIRHYVGQTGPDAMPEKAPHDTMGMDSWDPVANNYRHRPYNDYDKMPEKASKDTPNQSASEIEGVPSKKYEGPYRPDEDDGKPYYMNNWDVLAQRMKDESAWNDMYSGRENEVKPKSSLDAYLDGDDAKTKKVPEYKDDKTKRDGGFFGWLKNALGDPRKSGESDEEYDHRITQNRKRMAVLADTLRHMGNLINTSKGGLSQTFNSPTQQMESEYQQRKAQRLAENKQKADEAAKAANLKLKQDAAEADKNYKALKVQLQLDAARRAAEKAEAEANQRELTNKRNADNDKWNHDFKEKQFKHKVDQDGIQNGFRASSLAVSQGRLSLAQKKEEREGAGIGSSSTATLASNKGMLHRKKDLSAIEKKQTWQKMVELGLITKDFMNKYYNGRTAQEQGAAINYAIGNAASGKGKKNEAFREYLKLHHGYTENTTTDTPAADSAKKPQGKGKYSTLK